VRVSGRLRHSCRSVIRQASTLNHQRARVEAAGGGASGVWYELQGRGAVSARAPHTGGVAATSTCWRRLHGIPFAAARHSWVQVFGMTAAFDATPTHSRTCHVLVDTYDCYRRRSGIQRQGSGARRTLDAIRLDSGPGLSLHRGPSHAGRGRLEETRSSLPTTSMSI